MCPAMPARKPVVTGIDSRSATKPRPKRAAEREREADAERQRRRVGGVMRRAGGRQQRQRAGEDRRDGRIGADRHQPRGAEGGEADRAGEQRDEADLRREPREPRRRHLLGDGDRGERQAGDRVGAEVAPAPAGERPEQRPGLRRRGGGRGVHRFIGVGGSTGLMAAHSGQSPPPPSMRTNDFRPRPR